MQHSFLLSICFCSNVKLQITDMDETVASIVKGSGLPLSIIMYLLLYFYCLKLILMSFLVLVLEVLTFLT